MGKRSGSSCTPAFCKFSDKMVVVFYRRNIHDNFQLTHRRMKNVSRSFTRSLLVYLCLLFVRRSERFKGLKV